MNLVDKIKTYFFFRKTIYKIRKELYDNYNINLDYVGRLYTIFGVTEQEYFKYGGGEDFITNINTGEILDGLKLTSGDRYLNSRLGNYIYELDQYLINNDLIELYGVSTKKKMSKTEYLIVIEYVFLEEIIKFARILGLSILSITILLFFLI